MDSKYMENFGMGHKCNSEEQRGVNKSTPREETDKSKMVKKGGRTKESSMKNRHVGPRPGPELTRAVRDRDEWRREAEEVRNENGELLEVLREQAVVVQRQTDALLQTRVEMARLRAEADAAPNWEVVGLVYPNGTVMVGNGRADAGVGTVENPFLMEEGSAENPIEID